MNVPYFMVCCRGDIVRILSIEWHHCLYYFSVSIRCSLVMLPLYCTRLFVEVMQDIGFASTGHGIRAVITIKFQLQTSLRTSERSVLHPAPYLSSCVIDIVTRTRHLNLGVLDDIKAQRLFLALVLIISLKTVLNLMGSSSSPETHSTPFPS